MGIEAHKNFEADLLYDLNEIQNEVLKPGKITYIRESNDKKYDIYAYKLQLWWNRGWIRKKFEQQIWAWKEWTKFAYEDWSITEKTSFKAWEIIYLRVPKVTVKANEDKEQKESSNLWKVKYLWNKVDKNWCNWKYRSYTFAQWWNRAWACLKMDKEFSEWWNYQFKNISVYELCDKNGNKLTKNRFNKWEQVYYREANTDIIDQIPEMTLDDIMKLSDNDIKKLYNCASARWWYKFEWYLNHCDKKWGFTVINGKKIYFPDRINQCKWNNVVCSMDGWEGDIYCITLFAKIWNEYRWIHYDGEDKIYRWRIKVTEYSNWISAEPYEIKK